MRPRLGILELGLAILVALGGWAVWSNAMKSAARHEIFASDAASRDLNQAPVEPLAAAVRPAAYSTISRRNPFSATRGARARSIPRGAGQRPADPLPVLSGIADLGDGPTALLASRTGEKPRWVSTGENVGGYRLEAIQGDRLTFSFRGHRVSVSAKDLQSENRREAVRPRAATASPSTLFPSRSSSSGTARPGRGRYRIGAEFRPGRFAADATDGATDGTVYEGYVRRIRQSPFGAQHWWEKQE